MVTGIIIMAGLFHYRYEVSVRLGDWLIIESPPVNPAGPGAKPEVIYVMGGNPYGRLPIAVNRFHATEARELWCAATAVSNTETAFWEMFGFISNEPDILNRAFNAIDFPPERLRILNGSVSTWQDIELLKAELDKTAYRTILIVTDAYHSRRVDFCVRHLLDDKRVTVGYAVRSQDDILAGLIDRDDLPMAILMEYIKLIAYHFKY
jgi:uncharacterized SAM-binding protein YcdF (DUF218 family)